MTQPVNYIIRFSLTNAKHVACMHVRSMTIVDYVHIVTLALTPKHTAPLVSHSCCLLFISHCSIYSFCTQLTKAYRVKVLLSSYS